MKYILLVIFSILIVNRKIAFTGKYFFIDAITEKVSGFNDTISLKKTFIASLNCSSTKGSIQQGSNQLILKKTMGLKAGDYVIIETGKEAGKGLRGSVGVGGVWPNKWYDNEEMLQKDKSLASGTYAWTKNNGDVWRWDGEKVWIKYKQWHYYTEKAIPFSLRSKVVKVSRDGKKIELERKAFASTINANVYFDNSIIFNKIFELEENVDLPQGNFAIGDDIKINRTKGIKINGQGLRTVIFSPAGSPSASIKIYNSGGTVIQNFELKGNGRPNGFAFDLDIYPITQYWENPYLTSGGIQFFNSTGSLAKNIKVTDAITYALQAGGCSDVKFENCQVINTMGTYGYIGWNMHTYTSKNTVFENCTFASPLLNNAMEDFGGNGTSFINCKIMNGISALNKSANTQIVNCTVVIDAEVMPQWMNFGSPVFDINMQYTGNAEAYHSSTLIKDLVIFQNGYQRGSNAINGIYARDFTPNIKIKNYYYERPDYKDGGNAAVGLFLWANGAEVDSAVIKGSFPRNATPTTYAANLSVNYAAVKGQGRGRGFIKNSKADLIFAVQGIDTLNNSYQQFKIHPPQQ